MKIPKTGRKPAWERGLLQRDLNYYKKITKKFKKVLQFIPEYDILASQQGDIWREYSPLKPIPLHLKEEFSPMKKVLALVLVAVMAIGMGMSGFAATVSIKEFHGDWTLAGNGSNHDNVVIEGAPNAKWADTSTQVLNLGNVYAMDEAAVYIDLTLAMFGQLSSDTNTQKIGYATLKADKFLNNQDIFSVSQRDAYNPPKSWDMVALILDKAAASPSQLTPGLNVAAHKNPYPSTSTATYDNWVDLYDGYGLVEWVDSSTLTNTLYFVDVNNKAYGSERGTSYYNDRVLTADEIRTNKITMGTTLKADSGAIKDIELRSSKGDIRFRATDEWVSTGNKDFEAVIYLMIDGKRFDKHNITIMGNMRNPELEVYKDHSSVDISKGYVAVPMEFNNKIAVYVGNGATVHTKFFKDKKYYCITTRDDDEEATQVFRQYKDVDNVLTFKNVGLNNSDAYVTLSTDYADYWVYDKDMNYLGRGTEQLEFSQKFYLANQKLDIDDEDDDEDYVPEPDDEDPNVGGDGSSDNVNANPGTGR